MTRKIGILLTNTGTPDAPTPKAVRRYLREFLSDKRIVQLPRLIWLPILYGLILPFRAPKSAKLYQNIWTPEDSPMRIYMRSAATRLAESLSQHNNDFIAVEIGMNYGNPSIKAGLDQLIAKGATEIIVLPLFPQYSHTSTASSFDRLERALNKLPKKPEVTKITDYAASPHYIETLASTITNHWQRQGSRHHLLISFHGIPERFAKAGDPYADQCKTTSNLLAEALNLKPDEWTLCFQSQFGYDKWLKPSTQALLLELPKQGTIDLDIICPGFAVDCLETLEEISLRGREDFIHAGGRSLRYISALNDTPEHVKMLTQIILTTQT